MLEWFARLGGGRFSPLLIVREVQRLGSLDSHLTNLMSALTARKQRESVVPVILETSDSWWLAHEKRLHSRSHAYAARRELDASLSAVAVSAGSDPAGDHPSWSVLYVDMLDHGEVRRNVVDRWGLVNAETFERIWSYSGGFGWAFSNVMDGLHPLQGKLESKSAVTVTEEASVEQDPLTAVSQRIISLRRKDFTEFTLSLEAAQQCGRPGCEQAQLSVLTRLVESASHSESQRQWRLAYGSLRPDHQLAVRDLVRHNLLYVRPCDLDGVDEWCVEPACFTWRAQLVNALKRRARAGADSQDTEAHE